MKLETGTLIKSKAGHDKGRIYVIVSCHGEYADVADGTSRLLSRIKRKNKRHLQPILKMKVTGELTDEAIREVISKYTQRGESAYGSPAKKSRAQED